MNTRTLLILAVFLCALALPVGAADWPQWRGPDRTDISKETGLLRTWPSAGPTVLWTNTNAGVGYSGVAVVGDRIYSMGARGRIEYVYALDGRTGKELWSAPVGDIFTESHGDGPRCTPTVDGDLLYALGGKSDLVCVETAQGKVRWQTNLRKNLGGDLMSGWGYTESPLVDGDKLICTPGGARGTLAALDKKTGKVLWRSKGLTDRAAHSSAISADVGNVHQYIQLTDKAIVGVAADDGRLLWRHVRDGFRIAVIPTPIFHDDYVYATAGYGAGCTLLKLTADGKSVNAEVVYENKNLANHHGGVVLMGEHIYGHTDGKGWVCQNFRTGDIVWAERKKLGKGSVTFADGRLFCYSEDQGTLVSVEATPDGWKETGRFKLPRESTKRKPSGKFWTHPVIANGRLYLRDQDLLFCFDLKDAKAAR
jgi:outer membrane protein assembly factor BamB